MAVMKGKKAMIRRIIENRKIKNKENIKKMENKVNPEEEAERLKILKEAGLIK